MKRKIGLIIAMALALVCGVVFSDESASATGKYGNTYCVVHYGKKADYQQCAYVLKTYHNDELKAGDCSSLSKKKPKPSETCRVEISKHILTQISGCPSGVYLDCVNTIYNNVAAYIATNSTKKGNAGMPLPAKCYTTAHENDEDCAEGGDEDDDSGDSGSGSLDGNTKVPGGSTKKCSTLLPSSWCTTDESGIGDVLSFIIAVLTGTVVVAGTVGIIICAVLILTARDNDQQLAMGKKRLLEVVIGMVAWIMLAVLANLFIPKSSSNIDVDTGMIQVETEEERTA